MNVTYIKDNKRAAFEIQDEIEELLLRRYLARNREKIIENDGFHSELFKGENKRYLFVKVDLETFMDMKKFVRNERRKR